MPTYDISVDTDSAQRLTGPTINVVVGNSKEDFRVHEAMIRSSSPFFEKALAGPWKEASQRLVKLPEDEPQTFALYINWLYSGKIPAHSQAPEIDYHNLINAYILAERLLDTEFHNAVTDAVVERFQDNVASGPLKLPSSTFLMHSKIRSHLLQSGNYLLTCISIVGLVRRCVIQMIRNSFLCHFC